MLARMTDTTITAAKLAALIGISTRSISDLATRGIIVRAPSGRGFVQGASVKGYCDHLRQLAKGRGGTEAALASATVDRGRLARAQAEHVETKNAVARRELVSAAEVETEWSAILRTVRAGMLAVPSRCASRLPHLTKHDVSEIDREVRAALVETASGNSE
jgi:phage terminase Nu1 subunit (DNA packaging protein)